MLGIWGSFRHSGSTSEKRLEKQMGADATFLSSYFVANN